MSKEFRDVNRSQHLLAETCRCSLVQLLLEAEPSRAEHLKVVPAGKTAARTIPNTDDVWTSRGACQGPLLDGRLKVAASYTPPEASRAALTSRPCCLERHAYPIAASQPHLCAELAGAPGPRAHLPPEAPDQAATRTLPDDFVTNRHGRNPQTKGRVSLEPPSAKALDTLLLGRRGCPQASLLLAGVLYHAAI